MVSKQLIQEVEVKQLRWITDERGKLMEMLRCDEPVFEKTCKEAFDLYTGKIPGNYGRGKKSKKN